MLAIIFAIVMLLSSAEGRNRKRGPTVEFDGMAITVDENGNRIEVPTSECPGGCKFDGYCKHWEPVAQVEDECAQQKIFSIVAMYILAGAITLACSCIMCCTIARCKEITRFSEGQIEFLAKPSHVNKEGTPIGVWPDQPPPPSPQL